MAMPCLIRKAPYGLMIAIDNDDADEDDVEAEDEVDGGGDDIVGHNADDGATKNDNGNKKKTWG